MSNTKLTVGKLMTLLSIMPPETTVVFDNGNPDDEWFNLGVTEFIPTKGGKYCVLYNISYEPIEDDDEYNPDNYDENGEYIGYDNDEPNPFDLDDDEILDDE